MKTLLLNSAMMPSPGVYALRRISKEEFTNYLREAYNSKTLENYIGYRANIELIKQWTGIELLINRANISNLTEGDKMLIMRLKWRPERPELKSDREFQLSLDENDFDFFLAEYSKI